jgi:hypothetical protein
VNDDSPRDDKRFQPNTTRNLLLAERWHVLELLSIDAILSEGAVWEDYSVTAGGGFLHRGRQSFWPVERR